MDYQHKLLSADHLDECTDLYCSVFNSEPWNDGWEREDAKERLTDIAHNPHFFGIGVFGVNGNLVGFLLGYSEKWLDKRHFFVNEMCVQTELQSKGIGSKLMDSLEKYCKERNINRIELLTAREGQAEAFYKKNGFYVSPKMIMMSKRLDH